MQPSSRVERRKPALPAFLAGALILLLLVCLALAAWRLLHPAPPVQATPTQDVRAPELQMALHGNVSKPAPPSFDGQRAYEHVVYQVNLGPRTPGSEAHASVVSWINAELVKTGWQVETQEGQMLGHPLKNVIARRGSVSPWIILGAHYDSRFVSDRDPEPANQTLPVPGANDGASGTAVLLELARVLPDDLPGQVWLVFLDLEDNGDISGWDWILGSQYFVSKLAGKPDAAVIVDMIGDKDQQIYYERYSDPELSRQIWEQAASLGYGARFIPEEKFTILDDHLPFLRAGIPAIDIIDFEYPYWHTRQDTSDKVSADSLQAVGDTIAAWIEESLR